MPLAEGSSAAAQFELEQSLRIIETIGKKLVTDRIRCGSAGVELLLISHEAKLIRQLALNFVLNGINKANLFPPISDWLTYVNLSPTEISRFIERIHTVPELAALNDKQILNVAENLGFSSESKRRLRKSSYSLKRYILRWQHDGVEPLRIFLDKDLAWLSFDRPLIVTDRRSASESAADSGASDSGSGVGSNVSQSSLPTCTPPPSPGVILLPSVNDGNRMSQSLIVSQQSNGFSQTAPKVNCTVRSGFMSKASTPGVDSGRSLISSSDNLIRSHSHDSNLQYSLNTTSSHLGTSGITSSRSIGDCLSVMNRTSVNPPSPIVSNTVRNQFGAVQKSPKTGRALHSIPHQWHRRKTFCITGETCHFCQRQLSFFGEYEKCKSCKWKVHSHCKAKIGDSCGLTPAHLKEALKEMFLKDSGDWAPTIHASTSQQHFPSDSIDSSSSTNSSAPSTPAFGVIHSATLPSTSSPYLLPSGSMVVRSNFDFPDTVPELPDIVVDTAQGSLQRLVSSQGSDCTVQTLCAGGPGSSEGTLVTESIDSGQGYVCEGQDWQYDAHQITSSCALNRDRWSNGTIRVPNSWNDVTIPFNQIEFKKQSLIGKGRFGEVHKAYWYGDVAVKLLNMDHVDEEKQLEAFKADVASFKNTRHDNIVLFMGYCLDQHKLGIVMCYCKGRSLHKILHEMTEKLQFSQIVHLATQICHGVSYLHTKRILHKDLRTKNIFIENRNRAVITDFGLFSMKRLGQPSRSYAFIVPEHWLSYLAPELIKALSPSLTMIPFSESTDVFSFGTIWFELMTREFPFACMPPEAIIWQVGHGIKGALRNVNTSRDVKEILLKCWSYNASERPNFMTLFDLLERLPKKRVMRSPSFPVSRSYESVF